MSISVKDAIGDEMLELEMARCSYGFGRWNARYWFIGPEQGKGIAEDANNAPRVEAWKNLNKTELCDCLEFHRLIGDWSWHKDNPRLQTTWRPLILLLMAYLGKPMDDGSIRLYQRDHWGRIDSGETCLIELSGVAAKSLRVPIERKKFLVERVETIRQRLEVYKPTLVVMYGDSKERRHCWETIAQQQFPINHIVQLGATTIALTPHPASFQWKDLAWIELGQKLRNELKQTGI